MSLRWRITNPQLDERDKDFTASFTCTNADTDQTVIVTVTQVKGHPASDLIYALRATAQMLAQAARDDLGDGHALN